jgi:F420H(2)-dependent quinone reductase
VHDRPQDPAPRAVEVQIARRRIPCTATVLGRDDPEFAQLWKLVNAENSSRYDRYQGKTDRQIPLVALIPKT